MKSTEPVIVQDNATGRVSYWELGDNHSAADRNGVSLADYIHAMFGFILQTTAEHVLMIGCGGGTLATMLHRKGVRVTMVDINAQSFDVARRYFQLPKEVACHVADGAKFLRKSKARYDAIVLDAYSESRVPDVFLQQAFFDDVKAHLHPRRGIFLMNLLVKNDSDRTPDNIVRLMQKTWLQTRLLDCDGWKDRNAVALAGAVRGLKRPRLLMLPEHGRKKLEADFASMQFRTLRN